MATDPTSTLSEDQCWEFLRRHEFGRLAFHLAGEVHITPINYALDGRRIIFRTAEGSKLLGVHMNRDVAFEVDEFTETHAQSVVIRGDAEQLEGSAAYVADSIPLRPWVPTAKFNVVAIEPAEVSGRSFDLERPWLHLRA